MTPLRIGLVGYGSGGRWFHAPLLAAAPECEFVAVVTRDPGRRALLAREHPSVAAVDSLAELAALGAEAVAISTPAATHVPLVEQALQHGLAVVCDKPFALDAPAARRAVALAAQAGLPLSIYQNRRWDSDLLTLQALLAQGALGTISRFESRFERFAPDPGPPAAGGGTLLDFGSHLVDQALLLFGPVDTVYAHLTQRTTAAGRDDDVFLVLTHAHGVRSHLSGSWSQGAPGPRLRVTGAEGTYVVHDLDGQEAALRQGRSPALDADQWGVEPQERWGRIFRGDQGEPVPSARGRWDSYYPAFASAVRGEGPLPVDPADAVAGLEVLDAARTSAREARVVRC